MLTTLILSLVLATDPAQANPPQTAPQQNTGASDAKPESDTYLIYRAPAFVDLLRYRSDLRTRVQQVVESNGARWLNADGLVQGNQILLEGPRRKVAEAAQAIEQLLEQIEEEESVTSVTLDFAGGTLEEFVEEVTKKAGIESVVYGSDSLKKLRMRPMKLTGLDITKALAIPSQLSPLVSPSREPVALTVSWSGEFGSSPRPANPGYGMTPQARLDTIRKSICIIKAVDSPATSQTTRRAVFMLDEVEPFGPSKLAPVLEAIAVAIEVDGKSPTFTAKFHEPSGLLIVRGTLDELSVVAQVLRAKFPKSRFELPDAMDRFNDVEKQAAPATGDKPAASSSPPKR